MYYSHFIYDDNSKKTFELYNIQADPFELNDLSSDHPDIFNSMKKTLTEMTVVIDTPYINPVQSYLYGDRYIGINNSPWLERNYQKEIYPIPSSKSYFCLDNFLTFKQFFIPIIILLIFIILF